MKKILLLIFLTLPIVTEAQIRRVPEVEYIEGNKKHLNEVVLIFKDKINGDTLNNYRFGVSYFECPLHYVFEHSGFGTISTDSFVLKRNNVDGYNINKDRLLYGYFQKSKYPGWARFLIPKNCKKIIVWVCPMPHVVEIISRVDTAKISITRKNPPLSDYYKLYRDKWMKSEIVLTKKNTSEKYLEDNMSFLTFPGDIMDVEVTIRDSVLGIQRQSMKVEYQDNVTYTIHIP